MDVPIPARPGPIVPALGAVGVALAATTHVPVEHDRIQAAIDAAATGDSVLVQPGTYPESIDFRGKAITVCGTAPSLGGRGLYCQSSSAPVFSSCRISHNAARYGAGAFCGEDVAPAFLIV